MTITKDAYKYWQSGGTQGSLMGGSKNTPAPTTPTPGSSSSVPATAFPTPNTIFPQYSSGSWAGLPTGTWGPTGQPLPPPPPPPPTPAPGTTPPPPPGGSHGGGKFGGTTVPAQGGLNGWLSGLLGSLPHTPPTPAPPATPPPPSGGALGGGHQWRQRGHGLLGRHNG